MQRKYKLEKVKLFVPAKDLEHNENPESARLVNKLISAIVRANKHIKNSRQVLLKKVQFNPELLGYHVAANLVLE